MSSKSPPKIDSLLSGQSFFQNPQDILMNAPIGIFTTTPDGRYLSANNTLARMHGYDSPGQLIESITDIARQIYVDPADRNELKRLLEKHGKITNFECRLRHRSGGQIWISENISVIKDEEGNIIGYQGFNLDITERKQTEEALRESEASFKMLAEKCPISIFRFDRHGRVNFVNDWHIYNFAFNKLDKEFLLGKSVYELPGLINAGVCDEVAKIFNGEPVEIDEVFFPEFAAGSSGWVSIRAVPVYEKGVVAGGILIRENITERKNTESALKEKSQLLEAFLDNTPDIMSVKHPDLSIIRYNKAGYKFLQKSPEQIHGKKCYNLLGKEQPCSNCASLEAVKLRSPVDRETYVPELQTFFSCRANPIVSDDGRIEYVVELIRDITDRKQTEEALRESQEKYRLLIENLNEGVWQIDHHGYTVFVNNRMAEMLGYTAQEMLSKHLFDFMDAQEAQFAKKCIQRRQKGVKEQHEHVLICKDGSRIFTSLEASPILDKDGKYIGALAGVQDITARKNAEQQLQQNLQFQKIVSRISSRFVKTTKESFDADINETLSQTGKHFQVDRSYLILFSEDFSTMTNTHEWCREGIAPQMNQVNEYLVDSLPWWKKQIFSEDYVHVPDVNNMPHEASAEKEEFAAQDIKSLICIPVKSESKIWGFIGFDAVTYYYNWNDSEIINLSTIANIIGDVLQKLYNETKLIEARKKAEESEKALKESETRVRARLNAILQPDGDIGTLELSDILDIKNIQDIMDKFYALTGIGVSIIDLKGKVLVAAGWQDICVNFHRAHPATLKHCQTSDLVFSTEVAPGEFKLYKCRNNLWHTVTPIFVGDQHLGNLFLGQFLFKEDALDVEFFRAQARHYGFDEEAYLDALHKVSRWDRKTVDLVMQFYSHFASLISTLSWSNLKLARTLQAEEQSRIEREKLQAQLLQAQKMESIGIMAGGVAHDFNNLLQTMSGNIEFLLQNKTPDHPEFSRLQTISRSIERSARLVQQLLLAGRKAKFQKVQVNLNKELQEVFKVLERVIPKMVALELHLDPHIRPIAADPVQIEQVLLNLANNAVDAMPQGGRLAFETRNVELDEAFVKMHPGADPGKHVLLSVTDTGSGMDRETLNHIFDPFFTTKETGKGSGLGLATAYGIVNAHGGYIQCYSEPGQGTTFKIFFPAQESDALQSEESAPAEKTRGNQETILVVDDEPEIRDLTQEVLESLGYVAKVASSGEEALDIYKKQGKHVDLVLLDLNMPGMGGHKCLQELLQLDPRVRVIIASGYASNGLDVLNVGSRGYLGKPYQISELAAKIREVLDNDQM